MKKKVIRRVNKKKNKRKLIIKNISIICGIIISLAIIIMFSSNKIAITKGNANGKFNISIKVMKDISVLVDGSTKTLSTAKSTVAEVLKESGIELTEYDKVSPKLNSEIVNGQTIKITRVKVDEDIKISEIDYDVSEVIDYKMPTSETRIINDGQKGEKAEHYKVIFEDGKEVHRELLSEDIIKEPIDKIVAVGNFDPNSTTVCVNKERMLSPDFEPSDLVLPNIRMAVSADRLYMRAEAATALENLFQAAESDGIYLYGVSGYRSYYYQQSIYDPYSGYSAPPGASEHQLGLAMDVNAAYYGSNLITDFGYTPEGIWVEENAHKYGFIVRYLPGKESITGYYYEPWHIRYVGVELATELKNSGLTLEEYYGIYD